MADPKISPKGRLIALAVFGGLFLIAVAMMWYYWTNIRNVELTSLPATTESVSLT